MPMMRQKMTRPAQRPPSRREMPPMQPEPSAMMKKGGAVKKKYMAGGRVKGSSCKAK